MLEPRQIEELISLASNLERDTLVDHCINFAGAFPVDFTPDFLSNLPLDRLRHIFVALCLHHGQIPAPAVSAA